MNNNQKTLKKYEEISKEYAETNATNDNVQKHRARFASILKQGTIYDMGCGPGRDVHAFSELGFNAKGFDASQALLEIAQNTYPKNDFYLVDMLTENWNIETQADGVWCCASLVHFEPDEFVSVFYKLIRLLKTDGILYFSVKIKPVLSNEMVEGRFFQYYTQKWLDEFVDSFEHLEIFHYEENSNQNDVFASYFVQKL